MDLTYAPPFRNVVSFNVTNNNALTQCGTAANPYDTDGDGIIMDTFKNTFTGVTYPYQTLIAFNVSYNNGDGGESRPQESAQDDKWSFCLTAGTLCPANQERQ